jgi:hypothetical protein
MKKMLLLLAAAALSFTAAQAQTAPTDGGAYNQRGGQGQGRERRTPAERADMQTKRLTEQLSLSADQQTKVREIFLAQANEMETMRSQMGEGTDRQAMGQKMRESRARYDEQLKAALSADQYTKYSQMRDERMGGRGMQAGAATGAGTGTGAASTSTDATTDAKAAKKKAKADKVKTKVKAS